jgi:dihydrofolate reductase
VTKPRLVLVAAVAENGVIGRDGGMPWRLPGDLKHFKRTTLGKPIIMGRKTFDSIGRKPLPGRTNIVVSRDLVARLGEADKWDVHSASSFDLALAIARLDAEKNNIDEIAVIGGGQLYAEALPRADRLYLTEVHANPEGDARFPAFNRAEWREVSRDGPHREPGEEYGYSFVTFDRR